MKFNTILGLLMIFFTSSCDNRSIEELMTTAEYYEGKGDYEMANILYDETIKAYPEYTGSYVNKGANLAHKKEYRKAIKIYKKGLSIDPQEILFHFNLGRNFHRLEKPDSAIHYFTLGLKYAEQCDPPQVGQLIFTTPEEESKIKAPEFHFERALVYYEQEKYDLSISDLRKSIKCGYRLAESHYNYGACLIRQGHEAEGCTELNKALEYGNELAQDLINLNCK